MICRLIEFKNEENIVRYLMNLQVDPAGINIMKQKLAFYNIEINSLRIPAAIILKQEALSAGAELAIPKNFIVNEDIKNAGTALLMCSLKQLNLIIKKIRRQQFGLDLLANELLKIAGKQEKRWQFTTRSFDCSPNNYILMGIINVTPDSFYDGGSYNNSMELILKRAELMINEGAQILDIGGESTRPGAAPVSEDEEKKRVLPVIQELKKRFSHIPLSVDSTKYDILKACLDEGAEIINDISGLTADINIAKLAAEYKAGLCLMHCKGNPENMQDNPQYNNLIKEIIEFLDNSINNALIAGVNKSSIVIDPGICFGKTVEHNLEILKRMNEFSALRQPLLIGTSNKSFIGKILNTEIGERITGTTAANISAFINGASIFRVHNIKENKQALELTKQIFDIKIKN